MEETEEQEKLYLDDGLGLSYRSADKKNNDPLLYTMETIECWSMLFFFIVLTALILIFPGISQAVLAAYCKLKESGIKEIINDLIFQIKQLL